MVGTKAKQIKVQRAAPDGAGATPGIALQYIRAEKGLTLSEVSLRTGLPVSTLSKIENGKMSLTYDKLARLSTALEVDIAELFAPQASVGLPGSMGGGRRSVTRAGDGPTIETEHYHYLYQAADLLKKRFVPMVGELHARSIEEFGELIRHVGEEYAFVLEGAVEFHSELYAPVLLNEGDSVYFDCGMGHAYLAAASGPCRILAICSGPESQALEAALKGQRPAAPMNVTRAAAEAGKPKQIPPA